MTPLQTTLNLGIFCGSFFSIVKAADAAFKGDIPSVAFIGISAAVFYLAPKAIDAVVPITQRLDHVARRVEIAWTASRPFDCNG